MRPDRAPIAPPQGLAEQILQRSQNGIFAVDADERVTLWNRRMEELYGLATAEVVGRRLFDVLPSLEAGEGDTIRKAIRGEALPDSAREFPPPPKGRAGFFEVSYESLNRDDGSGAGAVAVVRDVTGQRRTEEMLDESESRFRIMADGAPVLLWMAGQDGDCTFFNQGWLRFTGRTLELESGVGWASGVHPEDFQRCMTVYLDAFVERRDFRMEYRLRRADGQFRWILDTGLPRFASDGSFEGYIGSCIDITDLRESAAALRRLNDELEDRVEVRTGELKHANAELEAFSYSVSHDLRAPLRAIDGFSNILKELHADKLDDNGRHYLQRIVKGTERMGQLIDDLLDLSRLTRTELRPTPVDLGDLARLVVEDLRKSDPVRSVDVVVAPGLKATADPRLLRIVLENLIGNAWKFTRNCPTPRIEVGTSRGDLNQAVYFVKDNGAGFDMAFAHKLFGAFQRLHRDTEFEGTGIGLATVARIVHRHGGTIWADAAPDRGATFSFTLKEPG
ncbi:MAG: PAS domain S-box protein [Planctomycetaceae bacterium]|nr:PAS domain S-box protein [Planctomycetaceae bacterium]